MYVYIVTFLMNVMCKDVWMYVYIFNDILGIWGVFNEFFEADAWHSINALVACPEQVYIYIY